MVSRMSSPSANMVIRQNVQDVLIGDLTRAQIRAHRTFADQSGLRPSCRAVRVRQEIVQPVLRVAVLTVQINLKLAELPLHHGLNGGSGKDNHRHGETGNNGRLVKGATLVPFFLYQLCMSLYCLFNPLRLNPDIPLRYGGGAVLHKPLEKDTPSFCFGFETERGFSLDIVFAIIL